MFDILRADPSRSQVFAKAMANYQDPHDLEFLFEAYDWSSVKRDGVVVDVGGSSGAVSKYLASVSPNLRFIVQDLEHSQPELTTAESELSRITFMQHDFFTTQPINDADVFLLRNIFHNWSDERCISILQKLVPAMENGAELVISDRILPEVKTLSLLEEREIRYV